LALWVAVLSALATSASGTSRGELYAFGRNNYGQLGRPADEGPNPVPSLVSLPGATGPAVQAAAGSGYSLAVTSTGQLYAFGENRYGQLGIPTNSGTDTPNPTPTLVSLPGASGPVTQVAAGGYHSLVVTSTGQLYAFGNNDEGQLGVSTDSGAETPNPTPTLVRLPGASGPVTQVAAGVWFSLALTSTGQVYAFGENGFGQLGNGNGIDTDTPNPTPTLVGLPGASGRATELAAGGFHSLVVTSTGQLYAFGEDRWGQLGDGIDLPSGPNPTPTLVRLPGASGPVTQVAAGVWFSLALTSTGQLYSFGENEFGQLGYITSATTPELVTVPGATGSVTQVAAGGARSFTLTSTGQLYAFGDNEYGALGVGVLAGSDTERVPTPTIVALPGGASVETVARGSEADHGLVVASVAEATTTSPTTTTMSTGAGTAHAARSAVVKRGKALVRLTCTGQAPCEGSLRLVAYVVRKISSDGRGGHRLRKHVVAIVIGKVGFAIAQGKSETLLVDLSTTGRLLLGKAGLRGLRVTVNGGGIQTGTIVLKTARKAQDRYRRLSR
jgi:alpha-tubulin suppressor-like RCC1 family protein